MAWIIWLVFGVLMMAVPCVTTAAELTALQLETHPFTGDWDAIFKRGTIRIVVPYSRTLYYNDRGTQRGITAAAIEEFQRWLDRKYKRPHRPLTVIPIPTTRDRFFPKLLDGHAEIAAGNLTITEARLTQLEFSDPLRENISEIILTHKSAPTLASIDELAGREVHVRKTSSYYESLTSLNERFHAAGKRRMRLTVVPDELEDEDMMEMMGAGLLRIIVVDDWKAKLWINAIPNIEARSDLALRTGGKTAWAMRKDTPKLKAIVNEFVAQQLKGTRTAAIRLANFQAYSKTVRNSTTAAEWKNSKRRSRFSKSTETHTDSII